MQKRTMRHLFITILILTAIGCNNSQTKSSENSETKFQWDFSQPKKLVYSFSQETVNKDKSTKDSEFDESYMEAKGDLNLNIKNDGTADLSLTGVKLKSVTTDFDGSPRDTTTRDMPPNVIQGMKTDGSFGDSNTDIMFKILFPLPKTNLDKAESDKIPMQMPFNANGSRLFAKGFNTLTFEGIETLEGRECAVLKGDIDISKMDVPEELSGEYDLSTTGTATYYFDLDNQIYVGADIKLVMKAMMDTETDKDDDFGMYMNMINDNTFKIRLKRTEE